MMNDRWIPACFLYVPGMRPELFPKALRSGAGAVIFDLEDAVALEGKAAARRLVSEFIYAAIEPSVQLWVRVNEGELGQADIASIASLNSLAGVVVPKASEASVRCISDTHGIPICPLIETAGGVEQVRAIAGIERVVTLAIGEVDLTAELNITASPDGRELWSIRTDLVVAAAAAGLAPPLAGVYPSTIDQEGLRADTLAAFRSGFGSRQAIHPQQVKIINTMFAYGDEEVARANRLIELFDAVGREACADDDGRMIDEAVVKRARRVVASVRRSERFTRDEVVNSKLGVREDGWTDPTPLSVAQDGQKG
jgi:citrate lyase subunit beta/citryl-CoA lyase